MLFAFRKPLTDLVGFIKVEHFVFADRHMLYLVLYTPTSLPMIPWPGTPALVVSRADKIYISALFAGSLVRNNILPWLCFC